MIFLLIVVVAALLSRVRGGGSFIEGVEARLGSRWAPLVVGLVWGAFLWWTWGRVHPMAVYHDELAYVLQAQLFAHGRWTAPSPPMADFFAQPHVLVAPVMASKYPPGHSLLLAIGALFGQPWIVVVALNVLRGAMTFILARRMANGVVALATCVFLLHGDSLHFGASFFSETTTGAFLLVGWYSLLRWHEEGGTKWIVLLAFSLGWCAITRPYSAVLFALPIGTVVLRDVWQRRQFRDLGVAIAVGTAIVAIIPLWSARTTGDWRLWPAVAYTRDYMPFDRPHFGVDLTPPRRELPPDLAALIPSLHAAEREHTLDQLPRIAAARAENLGKISWWDPRSELMLAVVGLLVLPVAAWVGVITVGTLFVGYLAHPTWSDWTIYYMETAPVLAFLAVAGLAVVLRVLAREPWRERTVSLTPVSARALLIAGFLCVALVQREARLARFVRRSNYTVLDEFRAAVRRIPAGGILFVRHGPAHSPHVSLIKNGPDWPIAPVWIVADRGDARNAELLKRVPTRRGYLFREMESRIDSYEPVGSR